MADTVNRQWILKQLPKGRLGETDFELRQGPVPEPGPGEVLTRTLYVSVDAANRAWMSPVRTYIEPVEPGGVMRAMTLGEVVRSQDPSLASGDIVEGVAGWQDFAVAAARSVHRVEKRKPLSIVLSGLGVRSLTAYFGLLEVGHPRVGETVLVSAAAGAGGSVAGQIAKLGGCRSVARGWRCSPRNRGFCGLPKPTTSMLRRPAQSKERVPGSAPSPARCFVSRF